MDSLVVPASAGTAVAIRKDLASDQEATLPVCPLRFDSVNLFGGVKEAGVVKEMTQRKLWLRKV